MDEYTIRPIGTVQAGKDGFAIELLPEYVPALEGLEGFSHAQIVWWFDGCDGEESRAKLAEKKPYTHGPDILGTFATRSPERPNPIAVSTVYVTYVDGDDGTLGLAWIDAEDGTPVLDIKPYTPSADRVERPGVPAWCAGWPKSVEASEDFDWEAEFNF